MAAHRVKNLLHPLHVLCHEGLLHLHLIDLLTELLAQSLDLGEGDGGVSPRAGSLGTRSFAPTMVCTELGGVQGMAWAGLGLQHILSSSSPAARGGADPRGGDCLREAPGAGKSLYLGDFFFIGFHFLH